MLSTITMSREFVLNGCVWLAFCESLFVNQSKCNWFPLFLCIGLPHYQWRYFLKNWYSDKQNEIIINEFLSFDWLLTLNIYYFWLIKITKVRKVKQMLQIGYSEVFLAICLSWMITINRAYVYKKYLNTRSIMTWLYCKSSSADIISQKYQFSSDATEPKTIFICKKILSVPS